MLVLNKKFDIRQWVLVTDFNPLTIWFFDRSYCRFGVEDFDINELHNRFIHLTNNSIVKNSDNFYALEIEGCMWHSEEMEVWLQEHFGYDIWNESINPKIK
jgi:tubulin monoglycylase TTLL3/8